MQVRLLLMCSLLLEESYLLLSRDLQYCPEGSVFDPQISSCAIIENASCTRKFNWQGQIFLMMSVVWQIFASLYKCVAGPPPITTTTEGSTTPETFVCPSDGRFPYEGNCTLYWICANGVAYVAVIIPSFKISFWMFINFLDISFCQPCPDGMVYNPNLKTCDFPVNGTTDCSVSKLFNGNQVWILLAITPRKIILSQSDLILYFSIRSNLSQTKRTIWLEWI